MDLTIEQKLKIYEWEISCFDDVDYSFIDIINKFEKDLINNEELYKLFYSKLDNYFRNNDYRYGIILTLKYLLLPTLKIKTIITLSGLIFNDLEFRDKYISEVSEIYNSLI